MFPGNPTTQEEMPSIPPTTVASHVFRTLTFISVWTVNAGAICVFLCAVYPRKLRIELMSLLGAVTIMEQAFAPE
jgi:hypothetical protein